MRSVAVVVVVLLVVVLALPLGMGADHPCPACAPRADGWAVCAAVLALVALIVPPLRSTVSPRIAGLSPSILSATPEHPPRRSV